MRWLHVLDKDYLFNEENFNKLRRIRHEFACDIYKGFEFALGMDSDEYTHFPVLYFVHYQRGLLYNGQSPDGKRRLWDLLDGDSHHLPKSFPPELWDSVIVINCAELLGPSWHSTLESVFSNVIVKALPDKSVDKQCKETVAKVLQTLESLLHEKYKPLFNSNRMYRNAGLTPGGREQKPSIRGRKEYERKGISKEILPYVSDLFPVICEKYENLVRDCEGSFNLRRHGKLYHLEACVLSPRWFYKRYEQAYLRLT